VGVRLSVLRFLVFWGIRNNDGFKNESLKGEKEKPRRERIKIRGGGGGGI